MTTYTATYSPEDNKLRLYASSRLDSETYAKIKAAGFKWAPRQELFVAPMWTPKREDVLIELAGEITDEDTSLVQRAEERCERFEEYSEKRTKEAEGTLKAVDEIAERFPMGQPILVGHHSEKRARKDKERIDKGMQKSIRLFETADYWKARAAGAISAAKYKELPAVRARRIKKLESEQRKMLKTIAENEKMLKLWQKIAGINDAGEQIKLALFVANTSPGYVSFEFKLTEYPRDLPASQYEGPMSIWSALDGKVIDGAQAARLMIAHYGRVSPYRDRWIAHYENRLIYERAMLAEQGGTIADQKKPEVGGAIRCWMAPGNGRGWAYIQKVNKVTVTVHQKADYSERVFRCKQPFEKIDAIMTKAEVEEARAAGLLQEAPGGVGFFLLGSPPAPPKPDPEAPSELAQKIDAMKSIQKSGGVQMAVAPQLFPTPQELAEEMVTLAELQASDTMLEPSAGTGVLVQAAKSTGADVTAVEINHQLGAHLLGLADSVIVGDFLAVAAAGCIGAGKSVPFDKVLMNPPFENGIDIKHIEAAYSLLKPGGLLVAICANGPRQNAAFKHRAEYWRDLSPETFAAQGTKVRTALFSLRKA